MKKTYLVPQKLFGAVVCLLLTSACGSEEQQAAGPRVIPVKLQTLSTTTLKDSSEYVGYLESEQQVSLAPRIEGRIVKILVQEGQNVTRGQTIVELEPTQQQEQVNSAVGNVNVAKANLNTAEAQLRETQAQQDAAENTVAQRRADVASAEANLKNLEAQLSSREADLRAAIAELELVKIDHVRAVFLVKEGVQPQQFLDNSNRNLKTSEANVDSSRKVRDAAKAATDQAKANVDAAQEALNIAIKNFSAAQQRVKASQSQVDSQKASITVAEGNLGAIQQNLDFNTVKAPIDGIVGDFNQRKVGDIVRLGDEITTITDNKVFLLNVSIPTEYYRRVRLGLPAEIINADGTSRVRGAVSFIAPLINQNEQSILVKFAFTNDGKLRNSQYVRVRVIWDEKPGVLVPTSAVTTLGGQKFVFVATSDTSKEGEKSLVVKQQPIEVGDIQGQAYQIINGVKAGDRIAVDRILDLRNNTPITEATVKSQATLKESKNDK